MMVNVIILIVVEFQQVVIHVTMVQYSSFNVMVLCVMVKIQMVEDRLENGG
jgi:hypothetical protein